MGQLRLRLGLLVGKAVAAGKALVTASHPPRPAHGAPDEASVLEME